MKISEYIGSQFRNPRGLTGKICCIIMNIINNALYRGISSSLDLKSENKVLDIGYGNGYLIKQLYNKNKCYIYGIDVSEDMKDIASKRNEKGIMENRIHLTNGDCCNIEYEDCFFDAVTSVNTIYFWDDTYKGLSEIYRVLKPGRIFSNAVYTKEWMEKVPYTKKGFKLFEPHEIKELAEKAGFTSIDIKIIKDGVCYILNCRK